jgi:hypothetical protein
MGSFVTAEAARQRYRELSDQVEAAYAEMRTLPCDQVGNEFRVELAQRLESQDRTNRGLTYAVFGHIADPPDETAMAPALVNNMAARLRLPPTTASNSASRPASLRAHWGPIAAIRSP